MVLFTREQLCCSKMIVYGQEEWRAATPHHQHKTNTCKFLKHQLNAKTLIYTNVCMSTHFMSN